MGDEIIVEQNTIKYTMVIKLSQYIIVRMLKDLRESINNAIYSCVFNNKAKETIWDSEHF